MTLRLNGSTSGYTEIDCPSVGGNNTLVLPTGNGSADQALVTNGSGTLSFADRGRMVLETAKTATSTAVDFTNIPNWVKRVTVMIRGVSSNGTSNFLLQLGISSGFVTTGYSGAVNRELNTLSFSTGFQLMFNTSAVTTNEIPISLVNVSTNTWMGSFVSARSDAAVSYGAGSIALSGTLDRVRITTVNGTDTFDAGSINILYEG
jgi:hypothetical protein